MPVSEVSTFFLQGGGKFAAHAMAAQIFRAQPYFARRFPTLTTVLPHSAAPDFCIELPFALSVLPAMRLRLE